MEKQKSNRKMMAFKFATHKDRELIHQWLKQPYINEWLHGQGLENTLKDLENFFKGSSTCQHWISMIDNTPFAYLITSVIDKREDRYLNLGHPTGSAISLDVFICEPSFLGKGLGSRMIKEFLVEQFSSVSDVFIDPEATNKRAIHVYEKVGFKYIREFIAPWHPVAHHMMWLDMKKLISSL